MKKIKLSTLFLLIGIILVCCSVFSVIFMQVKQANSKSEAEGLVNELKELMPEISDEVLVEEVNTDMSSVELFSDDFCGIIEVPISESVLPIYSTWDKRKVSEFPCRYMGSVNGRTLVIGGSDNVGQFDFMKIISNDDLVYVTDMTGARYTYHVTDIRRVNEVLTKELDDNSADLVLFAKNTYALDYTVVCCNVGK